MCHKDWYTIVYQLTDEDISQLAITKDLLASRRSARMKYRQHLEQQKKEKTVSEKQRKRKEIQDNLNEVKQKKQKLEEVIADLTKDADSLAQEAGKKSNMTLFAKSTECISKKSTRKAKSDR